MKGRALTSRVDVLRRGSRAAVLSVASLAAGLGSAALLSGCGGAEEAPVAKPGMAPETPAPANFDYTKAMTPTKDAPKK